MHVRASVTDVATTLDQCASVRASLMYRLCPIQPHACANVTNVAPTQEPMLEMIRMHVYVYALGG